MNYTATSWVMHLFQKTQGWQNALNTPHRRTRCTSPETEDHGRLSAEHRVLYKTFNYIQVCCTPMTLRRNMCHKGAFDKYLQVMYEYTPLIISRSKYWFNLCNYSCFRMTAPSGDLIISSIIEHSDLEILVFPSQLFPL